MRFYDWRKAQTAINGVPITNWATGDDVFKVERVKDIAETEVGADGKMTVSVNADKSIKVTIKLAQTSPTNAYLSKLANSQDRLDTFVPVVITQADTYRLDSVGSMPGIIVKHADIVRGAKANATEWVFLFEAGTLLLGAPTIAGVPTSVAEALG